MLCDGEAESGITRPWQATVLSDESWSEALGHQAEIAQLKA